MGQSNAARLSSCLEIEKHFFDPFYLMRTRGSFRQPEMDIHPERVAG